MSTSIRPEEITGIIKERIANFESRLQMNEIGTVLTIGDGVARVIEEVMSISRRPEQAQNTCQTLRTYCSLGHVTNIPVAASDAGGAAS